MGLAATAIGGCQLLLPDGEEDGTTTGNTGGAGSSSRSSTGKTSGTMKASSSADASSGAETTTSAVTTDAATTGASSSSGPVACGPAGAACMGGFGSPMPTNCASAWSCGGDADCTDYCRAIDKLCPGAYVGSATCCGACNLLRSAKGEIAECCHVSALNQIAAGSATPELCTIAGAFGTLDMGAAMGNCGTQSGNLCALYAKACSAQLNVCPLSECSAYFEGEAAIDYTQTGGGSSKLAVAMGELLSGEAASCAQLANMFCPITPVTSSSTGL